MLDLGIVRQDGNTLYTLPDEGFKVTLETRKAASGEYRETGIVKRQLVVKTTAKQAIDGECVTMVLPDGDVAAVRELRVTERYVSAAQLEHEREAKRLDRVVPEVRKRLGLSKSKQAVDERDKLTVADVSDWQLGRRKVMGVEFDGLPEKVKEGVRKAQADAVTKVGQGTKVATPTQLAELAALAAKEGKPLPPEWFEQFEAVKARQAKAKQAARKPAEVELTEQSDI